MFNQYYGFGCNFQLGEPLMLAIYFILALQIIATVSCIIIICIRLAASKRRSIVGWVVGGVLLGWFAVIILACLTQRMPEGQAYEGDSNRSA